MCVCARTAVGELEGQNAALVEVQLVLVGLGDVQDFHVAALHSHRQPLACRTVAQREDLQERNQRGGRTLNGDKGDGEDGRKEARVKKKRKK